MIEITALRRTGGFIYNFPSSETSNFVIDISANFHQHREIVIIATRFITSWKRSTSVHGILAPECPLGLHSIGFPVTYVVPVESRIPRQQRGRVIWLTSISDHLLASDVRPAFMSAASNRNLPDFVSGKYVGREPCLQPYPVNRSLNICTVVSM